MIYIAGDKHGYGAISSVEEYLKAHNMAYVNLGVNSSVEDINLEEMIPKVVKPIVNDKRHKSIGILSCGTGVGVEIGANKFSGIRATLVTNEKIAEYARVYDDCNVLCLVGWDFEKDNVNKILDVWFNFDYDGDKERLKMFDVFDSWH